MGRRLGIVFAVPALNGVLSTVMINFNGTLSFDDAQLLQGGLTVDFLEREIGRVGASRDELQSALAFVSCDIGLDPRAYDALSPRMRRLVDLVAVAGERLSKKLCDSPQMMAVV